MATPAATVPMPPAEPSTAGAIQIDTQHEDLVHDIQMDFYGAKLATCSSDRTIKVYNVSDTSYEIVATLQGHEGPVWQIAWAHPQFGVILASCSFDGSVLIHREIRPGEWTILHAARQLHESSVNGVAFAPPTAGLLVAAASSDGRVSILQHQPNHTWSVDYLQDCPMGVNAVSWAPAGAYVSSSANTPAAGEAAPDGQAPTTTVDRPHFVTAGCDSQIRFWTRSETTGEWTQQETPQCETSNSSSGDGDDPTASVGHTDWVRDVAWAPSLVPHRQRVASCSEDRTVLIWTQEAPDRPWKAQLLHRFEDPVWRVSWSVTGHVLAVSSGDANVTLWKEDVVSGTGGWMQVETAATTPTPTEAPAQQ